MKEVRNKSKRNRRQVKVRFKGCMWVLTDEKKANKSRYRKRSRTNKTYQKKVAKLRKFYEKHPKLKEKYPKFEDWLEIMTLKKIVKEEPRTHTYKPTVTRFAFGT